MVKIALKVSCILENLTELGTNGPDFYWNLKLQCKTCNEIDETWQSFCENDEVECKTGRATFNFQIKCKFCSTISSIDIVRGSVKTLKANEDGKIINQTLVVFDCRGVEPIEFDPQTGWVAKNAETNSVFNEVDFTEDPTSWFGFDERGKVPVSIEEFKTTFERA